MLITDSGARDPQCPSLPGRSRGRQIGMIKRLRPMPDRSVKILSDNPSVPPETATDGELHVLGRVATIIREC